MKNTVMKLAKQVDKKNTMQVLRDIATYGCKSGVIPALVLYSDTANFYKKHRKEINQILAESGIQPYMLDGWNDDDPLALDVVNQTLLVWFAVECAANEILEE